MQQVRRGRYIKTMGILAGIVGLFCLSFQAGAAVEKPEQKIWRALTKLNNAHALSFEGLVTITGPVEAVYGLYSPQAVVDTAKKSNTYYTVTAQFKGGEEIFTRAESQSWASFLVTTSDGIFPAFGMESRSVAGHTYISFSSPGVLPAELDAYKNMWIQLDFKSFLQEMSPLLESRSARLGLSAKKDKELADLIARSNVLKVKKSAVKKSGGIFFDVYTVAFDKAAFEQLLLAFDKVLGTKVITAAEIKSLNKDLEGIKSINGDVWISKKNGYPARIDLHFAGQNPKQKSFVRINFANFNQPQPVAQPAQYLTIEELFDRISLEPVSSVGEKRL
jgi:hypothetical protein